MYTCGPTVYDYDHIGHAWNYTEADILRRVLEYNNYKVKQVINITDVGHLSSDADTGEDKMEKSAKEKNKDVWEIAKYFTNIYFENRKKLNLLPPFVVCKATDHIKEMIKMVEELLKKGYAYKIDDGIYFDVKKFPKYGKLSGNTLKNIKAGSRIEINPQKRHPADFALWKFSPKDTKRQMEWTSPWGKGFPGWHIECSAMLKKYLGKTIDIHTGGEDNIFPHHESEIAQSESANKEKFSNYWFHTRFLQVNGKKMSKSLKNFYTLSDIEKKGFSPLSLRYLFLTGHYRSPLNFTWESLKSSQVALKKIEKFFISLKNKKGKIDRNYKEKFLKSLEDDLNTPKAISVLWTLIKDKKIKEEDKRETILDFDKILGLNLEKVKEETIPKEIKELAKKREKARKEKDWQRADEIRNKIENLGYEVEDTKEGPTLKKI